MEAIINEMKQINYESNLRIEKINNDIKAMIISIENDFKILKNNKMPYFNNFDLVKLECIRRKLCNRGLKPIKPVKGFEYIFIEINDWKNMTQKQKAYLIQTYWICGVPNVNINDVRKLITADFRDDEILRIF